MDLHRILLDPKTVLAAVAAGFLIGLFAPDVGEAVFPIGSIYVAFLSMCLLPILITAIIVGVAGLLRDQSTRPLFRSLAGLYLAGLTLPCVVGITSAVLLRPGKDLGPEAERSIGLLITESPPVERADGGILGFLGQIIPTNPFAALSANEVMSIVFLSVCLGLAMGMIQRDRAQPVLAVIQGIYDAFLQLFRWAVVVLAPGLLLFIAGVVAQIEPEMLLALTKFVVTFYLGGVVLLVAYMVLFWLALRGPLLRWCSPS